MAWAERQGSALCISDDSGGVLGSCSLVGVDLENKIARISYWVVAEA